MKLADKYLQTHASHDPNDKVRQALASPTKMRFIDTPLLEVATYLSTLHNLDIQFDRRALEDVGLSSDHPITIDLEGVRLQSGLRLMLDQLELTYVVDPGRLLITTPEAAEPYSQSAFYPCVDLIYDSDSLAGEGGPSDYDSLIDLIHTTVEPDSWYFVGGAMPDVQPMENGLLIRQSEAAQRKIAALLAALRTAKSLPSDAYDPTPIDALPQREAAELQKLRASLDKAGSAAFVDTPLIEVAEYLSKLTGSRVLLDKRALEFVGKSLDLPVDLEFPKATARLIFDDLTREHRLSYYLENESILITTVHDVESHMVLKVYPVRDLLQSVDPSPQLLTPSFHGNFGGSGQSPSPYWETATDRLLDSMTSTIQPGSWKELGGSGGIGVLKVADALVILQTEQNHEQIARLLHDIRTQRQPRPESSTAAKAKQDEPVLIRYPIPLDDDGSDAISKFARLLTSEVAAESWNDETRYAISLGKTTLLVKQTPAIHAIIRQWIAQLYPHSIYAQQAAGGLRGGSGSSWGSCYAPELFDQKLGVVGGVPPTPRVMQDAVKSGM
ncbi:hypothetical protein DSM3645_06484 [Blastopirellula marina DSM 3645]|uniref:Uncharacterized protein n=1 Tax=Blastopirellula marina DSM 3645 TaxID=314230 RepID=A4A126_9BACT|nr:hypothetical protein DSM3645_06484 [Blastopirellula marina DSM 3645]